MSRTDRLLARLASAVVAGLAATLRFSVSGRERLDAARASGRPILFVFWHNRLLLPLVYRLADGELAVLVSKSRDGDLIAGVANARGIRTVRGSSSRAGTAGARALARALASGGVCAMITPDGPRGPRYRLQGGAASVARLAGACVVPVAAGYSRRKVFRSWDRFLLPLPFARVHVVYGEPVAPPPREHRGGDEAFRGVLESRLAGVTAEADRAAGRPGGD